MNKLFIIANVALAAVAVGCKSIEVERHGQTLATIKNADGTVEVVKDKAGNPILLDGGWEVDYFQHWNWQKFDVLTATAGKDVSLTINNYESGADSNLTALVAASFDGGTKLAVAIGEAYVKIAGGGAQASTVLSTAANVYSFFTSKGGDPAKATVKTDPKANTITVTDGSVGVLCDASGNCSECVGGKCSE